MKMTDLENKRIYITRRSITWQDSETFKTRGVVTQVENFYKIDWRGWQWDLAHKLRAASIPSRERENIFLKGKDLYYIYNLEYLKYDLDGSHKTTMDQTAAAIESIGGHVIHCAELRRAAGA